MRPVVYIFVGYPGAGKTTVAKFIEKATRAVHLWADNEREQMFDEPTWSADESHQLYSHLNDQTRGLLQAGKSVVFDTNFNFRKDRDLLRQIAAENGADFKVIWLTTDKELSYKRATQDSHGQPTRVFGNMSHDDFDRIAGHLQTPTEDENPITLNGINLDEAQVLSALGLTAV
jgi:predicted kinase